MLILVGSENLVTRTWFYYLHGQLLRAFTEPVEFDSEGDLKHC
jgi:hypothetical protein